MCDEKTIKALPKWFTDWLKSKGYCEAFIDNLRKLPLPTSFPDGLESHELIFSAFNWSMSSQGEGYWDEAHCKFTKDKPWESYKTRVNEIKRFIPDWLYGWLNKQAYFTYSEYIENLACSDFDRAKSIECFFRDTKPSDLINYAFLWADSRSGDKYWATLEEQYLAEKPWVSKEDKSATNDEVNERRAQIMAHMPSWFERWLKEEHLTEQYIKAFSEEILQDFIFICVSTSKISDFFLNHNSEHFLSGAFSWTKTKEGFAFWDATNQRYLDSLKEKDCPKSEKKYSDEEIEAAIADSMPSATKDFLSAHGALQNFCRNFRAFRMSSLDTPEKAAIEVGAWSGDIITAFRWIDTPEGGEYWKALNAKQRCISTYEGPHSLDLAIKEIAKPKENESDKFIPRLYTLNVKSLHIKLF